MDSITEDTSLKMVGLELMFLTPEKCSNSDGITAVELAKLVNIPVEIVKKKLNILKDKNTIIFGDSLDLSGRWGSYFINYSECSGENYGNGSAGFTSQGITPPYTDMTFIDMLNYVINNKTETQRNEIQYIIVGGGINDALNDHTPTSIASAVQSFITTAKTNFQMLKLLYFRYTLLNG